MYYEEIDRRHVKALENILAEGKCEPGRLMGEDAGCGTYGQHYESNALRQISWTRLGVGSSNR